MNALELERDREAGADGPPPATKREIAQAIVTRFALTATDNYSGDILATACELAAILEDYGIIYSDLYQGIREPRRDDGDPS